LSVKGRNSANTAKEEKFIKIISADDVAAGFRASPLIGNAPFEVQFIDKSLGNVSGYLWDFNDGSTSTEQNPEHTFTKPGKYTVSLAVSSELSKSDSKKIESFIEVLEGKTTPEPVIKVEAAFSASATSTKKRKLKVKFTDLSTGDITSWKWNFGDGNSSTQQNPEHKYKRKGIYSVGLTVSDGVNSDPEFKGNLITVGKQKSRR